MHPTRIVAVILGLLATGASLSAQCVIRSKTGQSAPGPSGSSSGFSTMAWWDPDGAGPRSAVLVVGGSFTIPSVGAANLAFWDPATAAWGAFPAQPSLTVASLAVLQNGDLVIGGAFTSIGTQPANRIAIWNGASWSSPGGGVTGQGSTSFYPSVMALLVLPNGDLVAGGDFTIAGGVATSGLARWDGSQWHAFGAFSGQVKCMTLRPNGNLIVGGVFPPIGHPGFANIAEWNGSAWSHFGAGLLGTIAHVDAIAILTSGDVVASGLFALQGWVPAQNIARWDGTVWSPLGTAFEGTPKALMPLANGELLAASVTTVSMIPVLGVAHWNGSQWSPHAPPIGNVVGMTTMQNGDLLVAGNLATNGGELVRGLAQWDGAAWHGMAHGFDDAVRGLAALPNGDLVAFGSFTRAEGTAVNSLARWTGQTWWPMTPAGTPTPWSGIATCATVDALGTLWMAGSSSGTGGGMTGNVARWTGAGWQVLGLATGSVNCLVVPPNQMPIVGGAGSMYNGQPVVRWNGLQWVGLGAGLDGTVHTLLLRANGDLIAGGEFLNSGTTAVSRIARWDGTAWQPFGTGVDGPVRALAELPNGDLIAAGDFITDGLRPLNLVARWDGALWQPLDVGLAGAPGTSVRALHVLPNGDLLAGGDFLYASGYAVRGLARWDGSLWRAVDGDVDGMVYSIAQRSDGEIVIGGNFATVGGKNAAHLARLRTDCPATSTAYGAGCAGSAGMLALEPSNLPWLGGTHRAICYGVSATAIAVDLVGLLATQTSLATLHPAAGAGCLLLASPDAATLRLPVNGAIATMLALPNHPAFVGVQLYQQMVVGEVGATGALTHLASSNGLALTLGAF